MKMYAMFMTLIVNHNDSEIANFLIVTWWTGGMTDDSLWTTIMFMLSVLALWSLSNKDHDMPLFHAQPLCQCHCLHCGDIQCLRYRLKSSLYMIQTLLSPTWPKNRRFENFHDFFILNMWSLRFTDLNILDYYIWDVVEWRNQPVAQQYHWILIKGAIIYMLADRNDLNMQLFLILQKIHSLQVDSSFIDNDFSLF